jgi:hypothetical protein
MEVDPVGVAVEGMEVDPVAGRVEGTEVGSVEVAFDLEP